LVFKERDIQDAVLFFLRKSRADLLREKLERTYPDDKLPQWAYDVSMNIAETLRPFANLGAAGSRI
jgi:hypothetical protein